MANTNDRAHVGLAQVLGGAVPFNFGNINDTYRGSILVGSVERPAIIKDLHPRELANEVLAAALGMAVGLPIPPAFIAYASPDRLNAIKGPEYEGGRLLFASVDVSQPQVAMLCRVLGSEAVLKRLASWSGAGLLYGFDSLVANIDRHPGNLLFSGDREVWMIDHGHCFTGPQWAHSDLTPPDVRVGNRLTEWLTPALEKGQKDLAMNRSSDLANDASIDFEALARANYLAELLDEGDFEAVVTFLQGRKSHAHILAAEALGVLL